METRDILMVLLGIGLTVAWRKGLFGQFFCLIGIHGRRKEFSNFGPGYYWGTTQCFRCNRIIKYRDVQKAVDPKNPSIPYQEALYGQTKC